MTGDRSGTQSGSILLYDDDCGFCRWSVDRILRAHRGNALRAQAIQSDEGQRLLASLSAERIMESWHIVSTDGELSSAGAAVPVLLRLLPHGRHLANLAAHFPRMTQAVYSFVATNRDHLGRIIGAKACSVRPRG